jgi:hypothetical protein
VTTRLSGHVLRGEGKPCRRTSKHRTPPYSYEIIHGTSSGRALCECGEKSPELDSDGARKRWHRQHKEQVRGGYEMDNGHLVTEAEKRAIEAFQRLASRWPESLTLFSWSGTLCIVRSEDDLYDGGDPDAAVITTIEGIPNGGGAP